MYFDDLIFEIFLKKYIIFLIFFTTTFIAPNGVYLLLQKMINDDSYIYIIIVSSINPIVRGIIYYKPI